MYDECLDLALCKRRKKYLAEKNHIMIWEEIFSCEETYKEGMHIYIISMLKTV